MTEDALANTLLSRLSLNQSFSPAWSAVTEADYVTALGHSGYNDSVNGKNSYPLIADPDGADLNQLYVQYQQNGHKVILGRQRINQANERFVGGSAWRQNEQTFDALRYQWQLTSHFSLDYSYIGKINRVFGSKHPQGDWSANAQILRADYQPLANHKFGVQLLALDIPDAASQSTQTVLIDYSFNHPWSEQVRLQLNASYASQQDTGDNPLNYSADYRALEASLFYQDWMIALGQEQLGSDHGVGFSTPLATLHKFQGFADKFLATPALGVQDSYARLGFKWQQLDLQAHYHQFKAAEQGQHYGNELDLQLAYSLNPQHQLLVKYADYQAKALFTDTRKVWLQWLAKF